MLGGTTLGLMILSQFSFHLFLPVLGLHCCVGFSLVLKSRGYLLVVVRGLLTVVASLVVEHGL